MRGRSRFTWTTVIDGRRLQQLRRQRGLSQESLAYQAGVSPTTVTRLERQACVPCRTQTLGRLARALGELPEAITCPPPGCSAIPPK
jgi:transcriptional regulator with XRE-family HTH domain